MDSDDDDMSLTFTSSSKSVNRPAANKRTMRHMDEGLLAELHSADFSEPKRKSFLTADATELFSKHESRNSGPSSSSMSVRPMTAMSQAGDAAAAIPNLDDLQEGEVSKAPFMAMNNLFSYQELEKDLMKNAAFTSFDDLDFSPLFSRLLPESEVMLEDENWTWDKLVAAISSSLPSKKTA